jgi:hypothetical protein
MSTPKAFECYYFKIIQNWWHSPFKQEYNKNLSIPNSVRGKNF